MAPDGRRLTYGETLNGGSNTTLMPTPNGSLEASSPSQLEDISLFYISENISNPNLNTGEEKQSLVNIENRKKLPYSYTSGSKSFHACFVEMTNGEYVNEKAKSIHPVVEDEILAKTLSKRLGYVTGMGCGVLPSKTTKDASLVGSSSGNASRLTEQLQIANETLQSQQPKEARRHDGETYYHGTTSLIFNGKYNFIAQIMMMDDDLQHNLLLYEMEHLALAAISPTNCMTKDKALSAKCFGPAKLSPNFLKVLTIEEFW
ncbi:hypothetical protein M9H77_14453 [Catharanthus roseus]|uniref:Uncharacterized protein n=1 Tax=Catharanthus roseus TaxID=4058 RepID=A0ACC0BN31_CATRO|nr:hypothetical protein M9H77_14453 [Catharanthus roseus]